MAKETIKETVNYVYANAKIYNNAKFYNKKSLMSEIENVTLAFLNLNGFSAKQVISYIKNEIQKQEKKNEIMDFGIVEKDKYDHALLLLKKVDELYQAIYIED